MLYKLLYIIEFLSSSLCVPVSTIFPLFKTFYPGTGADFHYFGTSQRQPTEAPRQVGRAGPAGPPTHGSARPGHPRDPETSGRARDHRVHYELRRTAKIEYRSERQHEVFGDFRKALQDPVFRFLRVDPGHAADDAQRDPHGLDYQ